MPPPLDERVVAYFPVDRGENDYIQTFQHGLRKLGWTVRPIGVGSAFGWPRRWTISIINWPENMMMRNGRAFAPWRALVALLWLSVTRLCSKKVVFVLHNRYGHDGGGLFRIMSGVVVSYSALLADTVIVHSPQVKDWKDKYRYVPHPLYFPSELQTRPCELPDAFDIGKSCLIFGQIKPYKNIHTVLQHWQRGTPLLIAGPAVNDAYYASLTRIVAARGLDADVRFLPRRISESEIAWLMCHCRAVIVCHDGPQVIVSGAFFHAITYGCPVLAKSSEFFDVIVQRRLFTEFFVFDDWDSLPTKAESLAGDAEQRSRIRAQSLSGFGFDGFVGSLEQALR